jgi:hypothetical protein
VTKTAWEILGAGVLLALLGLPIANNWWRIATRLGDYGARVRQRDGMLAPGVADEDGARAMGGGMVFMGLILIALGIAVLVT